MLQSTSYIAQVLKVICPDLDISDYIAPLLPYYCSPLHGSSSSNSSNNSTDRQDNSTVDMIGPMPMEVVAVNALPLSPPTITTTTTTTTTNIISPISINVEEETATATHKSISSGSVTMQICSNEDGGATGANNSSSIRPIDGMLFLRELFIMSRTLLLEKR